MDHLFHATRFPEAIVPDYAKELTLGKYLHKAQHTQVAIHTVDMHNLCHAKDCIREPIHLYSRTMIDCNELAGSSVVGPVHDTMGV